MIDVVCKETSRHLLDVLYNKYKFMEHLKAMRRYLLLGQGDFIRHLMDLLEWVETWNRMVDETSPIDKSPLC